LTNKFARRFVMGGVVLIGMTVAIYSDKALTYERPSASQPSALKKEIQDAKDNFDHSRFGLAGCVDRPDRRGRGAPQDPKGGTRTGAGK
jgi:hypothetical protein